MPRPSRSAFSLKRSLGISTGLHLMLAPLFVMAAQIYLGSTEAPTISPTETVAVTSLTLERRPRRAPAAEQPHTRHTVLRSASRALQVVAAKAPAPRSAHRAVARVARAKAAASRRAELALLPAPAAIAPPEEAPATSAPATPAPTPSAEPTAADRAATVAMAPAQVRIVDVPPGGWGQNFEKPIVADDDAVGGLRSKYHLASAVSVEVDETGRAVKVDLPASVSSETRSEIERRLLEMRYIPAECNGLRCPGTLQIEL